MAIHESTLLLLAELQAPSVIDRTTFKAAAKIARPSIARLSGQVSRLQELLVAVEEDEDNEEVQSKLESFRQTLRAIDRQTSAYEIAATTLSQSLRRFYTIEVVDLLATVAKNE